MKAVLLGATGAKGDELLPILLADDTIDEVCGVLGWRKTGVQYAKLCEFIVDSGNLKRKI